MGSPVVHFEIHADDRPTMTEFYEQVFGWANQSAPGMPYTMLYPNGKVRESPDQELEGDGIAGGMIDRQGPAPEAGAPVNGFVCIIQVEDLDVAHAKVLEHGGTEALAPFDVEGTGRVFYFHDPAGNIVGCLQPADG